MVSNTPRPHCIPGKDPVPILQEAGWAAEPVWTGGKFLPHRDSIPDRPARIQSLYRLSYLAHDQSIIAFSIYSDGILYGEQDDRNIGTHVRLRRSYNAEQGYQQSTVTFQARSQNCEKRLLAS